MGAESKIGEVMFINALFAGIGSAYALGKLSRKQEDDRIEEEALVRADKIEPKGSPAEYYSYASGYEAGFTAGAKWYREARLEK